MKRLLFFVSTLFAITFTFFISETAVAQIHVVAGTYGKNCNQPQGNKTEHLAKACEGKSECQYKIEYQVIGDPAVGCAKDYIAEWKCGDSPEIHTTSASPEAGFGKTVELRCEEAPVSQGAQIHVMAGTYGKNCNQPQGNKTEHLAKACEGKSECQYKIDYKVIGDPAVGCAKDYIAEWKCGDSSEIHTASASPEAGYGKTVELRCEEAPVPKEGKILVVAGTYGKNCNQPQGNKTKHLAKACDGRVVCKYKVEHQAIGDPAVGCAKDYIAEWRCGDSTKVHTASASPEAGFGKIVTLSCLRQPIKPGKIISVVSGTYGKNCKQRQGNKTKHLADACNGKSECQYKVDYQVIGDPAVGCAKDYTAKWRCGKSKKIHTAKVEPEAGFGKIVTLICDE